jgi:apolipoprotein N-acyltransferase
MPSVQDRMRCLFDTSHLQARVRQHPYMTCFLLGHLSAYGMGPFYIWPALLGCLTFFWMVWTGLTQDKARVSYIGGFLFAFGFFVSSLWWIGNALLVGGNPYKWAYPLAACGLPVLLALFPTLALILLRRFAPGRSFGSFMAFIVAMLGAEFARGTLFTGFPWNLFGMSWTNNLVMLQILSVGGVYLLSFLTIFMFTAPGFVLAGTSSRALRGGVGLCAVLCGVGLWAFGHHRLTTHPTTYHSDIVVQIIQPNIKQEDKWDSDKRWDNYRSLMTLMEPDRTFPLAKTRIVVMPETALTYHDLRTPQAMDALHGRMNGYNEPHVYLLSGALLHDETGYHNALIVLDKALQFLESFDKFHLVPFGEYIPFQNYIPIPTITQFTGFAEGPGPRTLSQANIPPFAPLVCYEVIFPGAVVNAQEPRPEWMVNVTNDAWYGVSPGPYQHLAQAQYRAIEEGLPMVRAANTGISAIFDAYGRFVLATGLNQPSNGDALLPQAAPETIYSQLHR